mgnify:CR=1 FL=1
MLVSMLLLAILTLGAVSAQEDSSADVLAVDSASSHVGDGISYDKNIFSSILSSSKFLMSSS